ncbi:MAG: DinB family protein [Myxococcota bacterium]|nr:DinB family protein [Myxococcota bacterium]
MVGLAENNAWANLRLHRACAELTHEEHVATRTGFFPSLRGTLSHILIVDWYYVDALEGGTLGRAAFASDEPLETLAELTAAQRAIDARLVRVAGEVALDARVGLERRDHTQIETAGDVLLHLFQHQLHHRGQAHAMLAGTHVVPPQLDEFFLTAELPLREAELRELGLRVR